MFIQILLLTVLGNHNLVRAGFLCCMTTLKVKLREHFTWYNDRFNEKN